MASMLVDHNASSDIERWHCFLLPSLPLVRVEGAVSRVLVENEKRGKREGGVILLSDEPNRQKFHYHKPCTRFFFTSASLEWSLPLQ